MTLTEILADEELRRREFPVCRNKIFLAHAAVCPLPRRVADAVAGYAQEATLDDQEQPVLASLVQETRALAARLVGGQPDEIALVGPTSLALSFVAAGMPLRKGDTVIIYFDDYPSNVYPWLALAQRGIEVRLVNARELGRIRPVDVIGLVDGSTRLVALASCHFISGWRLDLPALGRALQERKIAFCVDGIQTLGAFPTLAQHADFIAADAHKWLLGPCGAGFLYVRRNWHEALRPIVYGWNNVRCPDFVAAEEIKFRTGAHRYEAGSHSMLGLAGLRAALTLALEIGVETIAAELTRKRQFLVSALAAKGWQVLGAESPAVNQGGITSVWREDVDVPALHARLAAAGIVTSLRTDRGGRRYLRLSPHYYNTDAELARVVEQM
jgi:cysteine desulfurase/selenocysteine lyase